MCDEFNLLSEDANLARRGFTRREFAGLSAGAVLGASGVLGGCASPAGGYDFGEGGAGLSEQTVIIETEDGKLDAFFVHPPTGSWPAVIMWPDVAGLREAKRVMARELAAEGYAVLVVNPYYRGAAAPILKTFMEWRTPEGKALVGPLRKELSAEAVTRDAERITAFLDGHEAVDRDRGMGAHGYCMGGSMAVRTAAAVPDRVRAVASFHGGRLVTDAYNSPHRIMAHTRASYLIAIAQNDDEKDPTAKDALRSVAENQGRDAKIKVFDADHGWCVPDSPAWDADEASKARDLMLKLFKEL